MTSDSSRPSAKKPACFRRARVLAGWAKVLAALLLLAIGSPWSCALAGAAEREGAQGAYLAAGVSTAPVLDPAVRDRLTEQVLNASLEVGSTWARINKEIVQTGDELSRMKEATDRRVQLLTLTNFATRGSMGTIGSSLIISKSSLSGNLLQLIGAYSMSVLLSMVTFRMMKGPKELRAARPNMLARVLGFSPQSPEEDYPAVVWSFLNSAPPGKQQTRLAELLDTWRKQRYTAGKGKSKERTAALAGMPSRYKVTLKLLRVRQAMLKDVQAAVLEMNVDLLDLDQAVTATKDTVR